MRDEGLRRCCLYTLTGFKGAIMNFSRMFFPIVFYALGTAVSWTAETASDWAVGTASDWTTIETGDSCGNGPASGSVSCSALGSGSASGTNGGDGAPRGVKNSSSQLPGCS